MFFEMRALFVWGSFVLKSLRQYYSQKERMETVIWPVLRVIYYKSTVDDVRGCEMHRENGSILKTYPDTMRPSNTITLCTFL